MRVLALAWYAVGLLSPGRARKVSGELADLGPGSFFYAAQRDPHPYGNKIWICGAEHVAWVAEFRGWELMSRKHADEDDD